MSLEKQIKQILDAAIQKIDLKGRLIVVEDEDGEVYYQLNPAHKLKLSEVDEVDTALIECAKLYRDNGVPNTSRYYKKIARMVHYALYELDGRAAMQSWMEDFVNE